MAIPSGEELGKYWDRMRARPSSWFNLKATFSFRYYLGLTGINFPICLCRAIHGDQHSRGKIFKGQDALLVIRSLSNYSTSLHSDAQMTLWSLYLNGSLRSSH